MKGAFTPGGVEYFAQVRELCTQRGALLIFDEIQTGFGRTGKLFATEHLTVTPDIMALGKAIGGGLPMGATIWQEALGTFDSMLHGSTFGANPLVCAASRAVLQVMAEEKLPERSAELGAWFMAELKALNTKKIREVRGQGLMIGVQLRGRVMPVLRALTEAGVWALPAGPTVLRLLPPLIIEQSDLEIVLSKLKDILK